MFFNLIILDRFNCGKQTNFFCCFSLKYYKKNKDDQFNKLAFLRPTHNIKAELISTQVHRKMRKLFLAQYKQRVNPILLSYQNNYHKFTFLENDFNHILTKKDESANNFYKTSNRAKLREVDNFIEQIQKNQSQIIKVQEYDFKESDLDNMLQQIADKKDKGFETMISKDSIKLKTLEDLSSQPELIWHQNTSIIQQLSNSFTTMTNTLSSAIKRQNLHQTILTLTQFNCLQLRVWQRLISFISCYYKSSALNQRLTMITALSEYMKKFQFSISSYSHNNTNANNRNNNAKKPAFKFMYPQSYIIDLVEFRYLFKGLQFDQDFITQSDTPQQEAAKLMILENFIYLIMKSTKKSDMNIYSVRQYFTKRKKQMLKICQRQRSSQLHKRVMYNIYFIYSYLNFDDTQFFQQIEKHYYHMLRGKLKLSAPCDLKQMHSQSKQLNKLLSIWKLNNRSDNQIYQELIKPFLTQLLSNNLEKSYYSTIALNLLHADITDLTLFDQIIKNSEKQFMKDDEFMHMLKHYLNVTNKQLKYHTNYHKCSHHQNPKIINHLNKTQTQFFSECLINKNIKTQNKTNKSSQHHRIQRIWSDIIKSIFQPKHQVIENAMICNYEIDFLIFANNKMYGIQIQGGHYNKKQYNVYQQKTTDSDGKKTVKTTGKKGMRELILKAYNIEFIKIHCEQKLPTYIMQTRNLTAGKKYLTQKLSNETGFKMQRN